MSSLSCVTMEHVYWEAIFHFIRMNLKRDRLLVQNLVKAPEKDQEERIEKKGKK